MPGNRAATSVSNTLATVLARSLIIGAVASRRLSGCFEISMARHDEAKWPGELI